MSQKKPANIRLQTTLNDLDSAIEQWDSLTSKPIIEQVEDESRIQKKAKGLLQQLRDQIDDFDTIPDGPLNSQTDPSKNTVKS